MQSEGEASHNDNEHQREARAIRLGAADLPFMISAARILPKGMPVPLVPRLASDRLSEVAVSCWMSSLAFWLLIATS